jgi:hypothetical protein
VSGGRGGGGITSVLLEFAGVCGFIEVSGWVATLGAPVATLGALVATRQCRAMRWRWAADQGGVDDWARRLRWPGEEAAPAARRAVRRWRRCGQAAWRWWRCERLKCGRDPKAEQGTWQFSNRHIFID